MTDLPPVPARVHQRYRRIEAFAIWLQELCPWRWPDDPEWTPRMCPCECHEDDDEALDCHRRALLR